MLEATAGAYTLLAHAVLLVPVVVVGLVLLSWEDLSFRGLARGRVERREVETDDALTTATPAQQGTDSRLVLVYSPRASVAPVAPEHHGSVRAEQTRSHTLR